VKLGTSYFTKHAVGSTGRKEGLLPWLSDLPLTPAALDFSNKTPLVQVAQR